MRTRKQPEERRREIFAAAERLFTEQGYAATTVADITKAAGVAKGTFFYYFETKDALLAAIGRHWAQEFARRYQEAEKGADAVAHLLAFLRIFEGDDPLEPMVDRLIGEHQYRLMETIWQAMRDETMDPLLAGILREGAAEGSMHLASDAKSCIHFFWHIYDAVFPMEDVGTSLDEAPMAKYLVLGHRLLETMLGLPSGTLEALEVS